MTPHELVAELAVLRSRIKHLEERTTNIPLRVAGTQPNQRITWFDAILQEELPKGQTSYWSSAKAILLLPDKGQPSYHSDDKEITVYDVGFVQKKNPVPADTLIRVLVKGKRYFYDGRSCDKTTQDDTNQDPPPEEPAA